MILREHKFDDTYISLIDEYYTPNSKDKFVKEIANLIKDSDKIGFAGYLTRSMLKNQLRNEIFDNKSKPKGSGKVIDDSDLKLIIKTIKKCKKEIPSKQLHIFVFPTFSDHVIKRMDGATGSTPYHNTFNIFVVPYKFTKVSLENTVCHEYFHAVYRHDNYKLLDRMINEGLAEHFREHVIGGKRAEWAKAVSSKKCKIIFMKLRSKLKTKNYHLISKILFGSKDYRMWTGYSIGYNIVKDYLKNTKRSWKDIVKKKPEEILSHSNFD